MKSGIAQKELRTDEDDLDLLALDTAISLERYLEGESLDDQKVESLLSRLRETPGMAPNGARSGVLPNPSTIAIYHRAMRGLLQAPVNTIDDLRQAMMTIVDSQSLDDLSREKAEVLRDFCCRLHDELISVPQLPRRLPDDDELRHRAA